MITTTHYFFQFFTCFPSIKSSYIKKEAYLKQEVEKIICEEYIKKAAMLNRVTVEKCRHEIEYAIKKTAEHPNTLFIKMFGNRIPSIEEFIFKILVMAEKEMQNE